MEVQWRGVGRLKPLGRAFVQVCKAFLSRVEAGPTQSSSWAKPLIPSTPV